MVSLGVEYKYNDRLTLRAGYSHNTQPVSAANVMLNILAPGIVTDHIAGGFSYGLTPQSVVDFAVVYAPKATVSGQEYLPGLRLRSRLQHQHLHVATGGDAWPDLSLRRARRGGREILKRASRESRRRRLSPRRLAVAQARN